MFKKLRILWQDDRAQGDGVEVERSELRLRTIILVLAALVVPPLVLFLYYKTMFAGLINVEALDFAQLGRNLSSGKGFVTYILRPVALTHGNNPFRQPEMIHGPLYPLLLAIAFTALGAKDTVAAMVSGVFYLLAIPVVYQLGKQVFSRMVGLLVALVFTFNALMLQYAASGLHITLYVFLTSCVMLTVYQLAAYEQKHAANAAAALPKGKLALVGLLGSLLYLTDPIFLWALPVLLGTVAWIAGRKRGGALMWSGLPLVLLVLPWMARNWMVAGNPFFGLRGLEVLMHTSVYQNEVAYRMIPTDIIPSVALFQGVVKKILTGAGDVIQSFPQVTASWVLAFFLPCLLFRFADPAANQLRRVTMLTFLSLLAGTLLFRINMPLFVALIPTMLVFSVAFLLHLVEQAQLSRGSRVLATLLFAVGVGYPLVSDIALSEKPTRIIEADTARVLAKEARRTDVALSDQPWLVAWYADRPAVWIPANDDHVKMVRAQFPEMRWLMLTQATLELSPSWQALFQQFSVWKAQSLQGGVGGKPLTPITVRVQENVPLSEGLEGFSSVEQSGTPLNTVLACVPADKTESERSSKMPLHVAAR